MTVCVQKKGKSLQSVFFAKQLSWAEETSKLVEWKKWKSKTKKQKLSIFFQNWLRTFCSLLSLPSVCKGCVFLMAPSAFTSKFSKKDILSSSGCWQKGKKDFFGLNLVNYGFHKSPILPSPRKLVPLRLYT